MQRIFLTGLSGSGKSTVAQQVAKLLSWDFVDTDALLSERCGLPVGQILIEYGEQRFRHMETEALISTAKQERVVIATGGGVVIAEANRMFMREHGLIIYLQVSVETAWRRLQEHMSQSGMSVGRPLVAGTDGQQRLQDLYSVRKQWYEQAAVCINTGGDPASIVAGKVVAFALAYGYLSSAALPQEAVTLKPGTVDSHAVIEWGDCIACHRLYSR